jgi:hypothetical protein
MNRFWGVHAALHKIEIEKEFIIPHEMGARV